jgi:hypothetical protein
MKLVYVVGPYRAKTEYGVLQNIQRAEQLALQVWLSGAACICPQKNTAFFGGAADDQVWLNGDLEMIRRCDAIVCVDGWQTSKGSVNEVALAHDMGIPVFETIDEMKGWLKTN